MEEARYVQNHLTQDSFHQEDEAIDTLSLSDLLIYHDYNGTHDHPHEDDFYQLNDDQHEDDDQAFEFSSELLKTSRGDNVVFCGKIIPYKEPNVFQDTLESKKVEKSHKKRWRFLRFFKKSSKPKLNIGSEKVIDLPIRRVSILASAATKPRWYVLMFGFRSTSFPAKLHIRNPKKRKTTRTEISRDSKISGGSGGGGIGSWRLATLLGCGGGGSKHDHPNATIMKIE